MNLADLKAPFAPNKISWRIGSTNGDKTKGMALAYIDARDVQDRLDEICGADGWQCRYVPMHDKKTVCEIGIRIFTNGSPELDERGGWKAPRPFEWIWKSDGAGDSDIEAEKGALSDAFKRAAVRWGVGRYLYDLDSPWVAITAAGRSFKIADHEYKRLEALLANSPKPTQRDAIHGASTLKTPVAADAYAPADVGVKATNAAPTVTPQSWAQTAIDRVNGFSSVKDLDAFEKKFTAKIVQIAPLVPDLHAKLVSAIADRRFVLEAQG